MLGFVTIAEKGAADRLLADFAAGLEAAGRPVVAMVRAELPAARACEMALRLYPSGEVAPISQSLGAGADACTLDAGALEAAVMTTTVALATAAPGAPLILNKFGKQESEGHGSRALIAAALEAGHPVLISVPPATRAAFLDFAGDLATELAPEPQALGDFLAQLCDGSFKPL